MQAQAKRAHSANSELASQFQITAALPRRGSPEPGGSTSSRGSPEPHASPERPKA